jgi:Rrf2 family protein
MKHLSQTTIYALQAVYDLAAQSAGEPVPIADISRRQDVPRRFLEEILRRLREAGLVKSTRGKRGGYELNIKADLLKPGAVVRVFELEKRVDDNLSFGLSSLLNNASTAYFDMLNRCTFDDLVRQSSDVDFIPNYCI